MLILVDEHTPIPMDKRERIEISVSVPQLNMKFDLNQPVNGQTRLLLMLINTKLRVSFCVSSYMPSLFYHLSKQSVELRLMKQRLHLICRILILE